MFFLLYNTTTSIYNIYSISIIFLSLLLTVYFIPITTYILLIYETFIYPIRRSVYFSYFYSVILCF